MTAREIAEASKGKYGLSVDMLEDEIVQYAKQKCKEQRKLCYESHWDMSCSHPDAQFEEDNIRDTIIDAPTPFDNNKIDQ